MSIRFATLVSYMKDIGLGNNDADVGRQLILSGISTDSGDKEYPTMEKIGVVISLQEEGEFLQIRLFGLVSKDEVQASQYRKDLAVFFCRLNSENKIGRWCMQTSSGSDDGEIYLDWGMSIEDNETLTLNQMKRTFGSLVSALKEAWGPMKRILKTGSEEIIDLDRLKLVVMEKINADKNKAHLIIKVLGVSDAKKLQKIDQYLDEQRFDEVEQLLDASS